MIMCTPKHYSIVCKTVALISFPIGWFFEYGSVVTAVWASAYLAAGACCDCMQLIFDRLPPGGSDDHPSSRKPKSRASVYRNGEYHAVQDGKD